MNLLRRYLSRLSPLSANRPSQRRPAGPMHSEPHAQRNLFRAVAGLANKNTVTYFTRCNHYLARMKQVALVCPYSAEALTQETPQESGEQPGQETELGG